MLKLLKVDLREDCRANFGGNVSSDTPPSGGFYNELESGGIYNEFASGGFYNELESGRIYNEFASGGFYNEFASGGFYIIMSLDL